MCAYVFSGIKIIEMKKFQKNFKNFKKSEIVKNLENIQRKYFGKIRGQKGQNFEAEIRIS